MKNIHKFLTSLIFIVVVIMLVPFSFAEDDSSVMEFIEDTHEMYTADTTTLYLTAESSNAVTWESSNTNIVNVQSSNTRSAVVNATGAGSATITATDASGNQAVCVFTVNLLSYQLSDEEITIGLEANKKISVQGGNYLKWTSSNQDIAYIDRNGTFDFYNNGVTIYGHGLGTAYITVTDKYGAEATCKVTVVNSQIELDKNEITLQPNSGEEVKVISGNIESIVSSNDSLVTASTNYDSGSSFYISAEDAIGDAIITVKEKRGAEATLRVHVKSQFTVEPTHLDVNCSYNEYYRYDSSYLNREPDVYGVPRYAIAYCNDWSGYIESCDRYISGYSDNYSFPGIVSARSLNPNIVEIDGQWIMPRAVGTASIECYDVYGQKRIVTVTVHPIFANSSSSSKAISKTTFKSKSYSMYRNKTKNMKNCLLLKKGDKVKKWKVNKKKLASISKKGILKAKKTGKVKVTAILKSGKKVSCTVVIKNKKKSSSGSGKVYWTPSGSVYHKSKDCPTLSKSKVIKSGTIKKSRKKRCCKVCG